MNEDSLFIKQAEILDTIKAHGILSTDNIQRRFLGIKERTLRYHLKRLQDHGLIKKRGTTNGVYYEAINFNNPGA